MLNATDKPAQDHAAEAARVAAGRAKEIERFLGMVAYNAKSAAKARAAGSEFLAQQYDGQADDCRNFIAMLA